MQLQAEAGLTFGLTGGTRRWLPLKNALSTSSPSNSGSSKEQITPETSFVNDLGADSLDVVELVMELEEEFDINIPDDAAEKIQTVGQAVEYIEKTQS